MPPLTKSLGRLTWARPERLHNKLGTRQSQRSRELRLRRRITLTYRNSMTTSKIGTLARKTHCVSMLAKLLLLPCSFNNAKRRTPMLGHNSNRFLLRKTSTFMYCSSLNRLLTNRAEQAETHWNQSRDRAAQLKAEQIELRQEIESRCT